MANGANSSQNINTACNQRIRRAVLIFVPAIRSPDFELRNSLLYVLNLLQELRTSEVTAV